MMFCQDVFNSRSRRIIGKYLGKGSFGQVVSNPRIPLEDEDILELIETDEVSKIFKYKCDYDSEIKFYEENKWINDYGNYFVLPLAHGEISRSKIENYNLIYRDCNYNYNLSNDLSKQNLYHIIYKKELI